MKYGKKYANIKDRIEKEGIFKGKNIELKEWEAIETYVTGYTNNPSGLFLSIRGRSLHLQHFKVVHSFTFDYAR